MNETKRAGTRAGRTIRRTTRILAGILGAILALVLLVLLALQIRPVREALLREGLRRADTATPGSLEVGEAGWPGFTRLSLGRVLWTDQGDTLVRAERVELSFDLRPLVRKDVRVREVTADIDLLDLPAIQARFPAGPDTAPAPQKTEGGFPRKGSVPGLPSIAVDQVRVNAAFLRIAPDRTVRDLRFLGGLDLRKTVRPRARIDTLHLIQPETGVSVEQVALTWSLEGAGIIEAGGTGRLGPDFPFTLEARTEADGGYWLSFLKNEGVVPPDGIGLLVKGRLERRDLRSRVSELEGITAEVLLRTPDSRELASLPLLRSAAEKIPEMSGLIVSGEGNWRFGNERRGSFRAIFEPNGWIEGGHVEVTVEPGRLEVLVPTFRFTDLSLTGEWRQEGDAQRGSVAARIRGSEWARPFLDPSSLPDSISLDLEGSMEGSALRAEVRGGVRRGQQRFEDIALLAEGRLGETLQADLGFTTRTSGLVLSGAATVEKSEEILAVLSPLRVLEVADNPARTTGRPPLPGAAGPTRLRFHPQTGQLEVSDLRVTGSFGDLSVDGSFQKERGGRFDFAATWPEAPSALMRRLEIPAESIQDMAVGWRRNGPYRAAGTAVVRPQGSSFAFDASAVLSLPGPSTLSPALPQGARVQDLGNIAGSARVSSFQNRDGTSGLRFSADLGRTEWIERLLIEGSKEGERTLLDTLDVRLEGFEASGGMRIVRQKMVGRFRVALRDPRLLTRFAPSLGDSVDAAFEGSVDLAGAVGSPSWDARLNGHFLSRPADLHAFEAHAFSQAGQGIHGRLRVHDGVRFSSVNLDSLNARLDPLPGPAGGPPAGGPPDAAGLGFSGRITMEARGENLQYDHSFDLTQSGGLRIRTDSLYVRMDEEDLRAQSPFTVLLREKGGGVVLEGLDLAGSIGSVKGGGIYAPGRIDLEIAAALELPEQPSWIQVPPGLWPSTLDLQATARTGDSLVVQVRGEGLQVGPRKNLTLLAHLRGLPDRLEGRMRLQDGDGALVDAAGYLAGALRLSPFGFTSRHGAFGAQAVFKGFPLPSYAGDPMTSPGYLDRGKQERAPALDLMATAGGTTAAPVLQAGGAISFPEYRELKDYRFLIQAQLLPDESSLTSQDSDGGAVSTSLARYASALDAPFHVLDGMSSMERTGFPDSLEWVAIRDLPSLPDPMPGLSARIRGLKKDQEILTGDAVVPIRFALAPAGVRLLEEPMKIQAASPDLSLEDIAPLVAAVERMSGKASFSFTAEGSARNPALSGELEIPKASLSRRDGTQAAFHGSASLSGTLESPTVRGRMIVDNGTIKIPETPNEREHGI